MATSVCPNCEQPVRRTARKCRHCGAALTGPGAKRRRRPSPAPADTAAAPSATLAACPDCGNEVSRKATACPHCGAPLRRGEERIVSVFRILCATGAVLCLLLGFLEACFFVPAILLLILTLAIHRLR